MNATRKLDLYLESFNQRLRKMRLLQGSAVLAAVLLVVGGVGAWFSAESGFASTTTNAFRILLVLALGLVHGLGFASAMQEEGGSQLIALSPYPIWSILGFNLGIEAGQCAVALVLGLWVWCARRIFGRSRDVMWQRAAGMGALAIGGFWLVDRIVS